MTAAFVLVILEAGRLLLCKLGGAAGQTPPEAGHAPVCTVSYETNQAPERYESNVGRVIW